MVLLLEAWGAVVFTGRLVWLVGLREADSRPGTHTGDATGRYAYSLVWLGPVPLDGCCWFKAAPAPATDVAPD